MEVADANAQAKLNSGAKSQSQIQKDAFTVLTH